MKRSFLLIGIMAVIASSFQAADNVGNESTKYTDRLRAQDSAGVATGTGRKKDDRRGKINDDFYDTVIYNDIYEQRSFGRKHKSGQEYTKKHGRVVLASPATTLSKIAAERYLADKKKTEEAERIANEKKESPEYFVGGYCTIMYPVKIIRNSEFTTLDCLLDFGDGNYRDASIFAGVYPNYKLETLTVLPILATFKNQKKGNFNGIVLDGNKRSLNIADHVESYAIRKLVAKYGLAINDVAYRYATAYMGQLQASRTSSSVSYVPTTLPDGSSQYQPVVTQKTKLPDKEDYFAMAGIELISKLFSIGAKDMLEKTDPLFSIYKGKRVWVEGVVSFDSKGLAKKYGVIAETTKGNIDRDNSQYQSAKRRMIDQSTSGYTKESMINTLNRTQQIQTTNSTGK